MESAAHGLRIAWGRAARVGGWPYLVAGERDFLGGRAVNGPWRACGGHNEG